MSSSTEKPIVVGASKARMTKHERRKADKRAQAEALKEIGLLRQRLRIETPPAGSNPWLNEDAATQAAEPRFVTIDGAAEDELMRDTKRNQRLAKSANRTPLTTALLSSLKTFAALPISSLTLKGLAAANYTHLTRVQRGALPHALAGRDVLASARTGSGKTLAYLIPVLERLYVEQWDREHGGLGALIISPTRELAVQIFTVMRKIGRHHTFSAGLVIGGKDAEQEKKMIGRINILVATPGRLLHHMDETYDFDTHALRVLVLDEADRLLEMGFADVIDGILDNLPKYPQRQTLLFSATQTSEAMRNLVKLSLHKAEVIGVHDKDDQATPVNLYHHYLVCNAGDKVNMLYGFIKTHQWQKTLVFLSSTKQVRFFFEAMCRLRPGVPIMHIHGGMKLHNRLNVFTEFCNQERAVLFATDVTARGLDFTNVNWVLQLDCPETVADYIHRVGRTARFNNRGNAMLLLQEHELPFIEKLAAAKVFPRKVGVQQQQTWNVTQMLAALCAEDTELKYLAQRAFVSYIRQVHLAADKDVFSVREVDGPALALSMGLPGVPTIKSLRGSRSALKNMPHQLRAMQDKEREKAKAKAKEEKKRLRDLEAGAVQQAGDMERMVRRKNATVLDESRLRMRADQGDDEDDDFLTIGKRNLSYDEDVAGAAEEGYARAQARKLSTMRELMISEADLAAAEAEAAAALENDEETDLIKLIEADISADDDESDDDEGEADAEERKSSKSGKKSGKKGGADDDDDAHESDEEGAAAIARLKAKKAAGAKTGDESKSKDSKSLDERVLKADRERTERKAAKRAARQRELDARLRAAMVTENMEVKSLDEALKEGIDGSFVKELRGRVKSNDAQDRERHRERVHQKYAKAKAERLAALRAEQAMDGDYYQLPGTDDDESGSDGDDLSELRTVGSGRRVGGSGSDSSESDSDAEVAPKNKRSRAAPAAKKGKKAVSSDDDDSDSDTGSGMEINLNEDSD